MLESSTLLLLVSSTSSVSETPNPEEKVQTIPSWIKNNAGWWSNGEIDDKTFVQGIEYLVKNGIIAY